MVPFHQVNRVLRIENSSDCYLIAPQDKRRVESISYSYRKMSMRSRGIKSEVNVESPLALRYR
jgi:hypothetical protein